MEPTLQVANRVERLDDRAIELALARQGVVDPAFGSGSFEAEQVRRIHVLANP